MRQKWRERSERKRFVGISDICESRDIIIPEGSIVGINRSIGLFVLGGKELDLRCGELQRSCRLICALVDVGRCRSRSTDSYFAAFHKVLHASICGFSKDRHFDVCSLGCFAPTFVDGYGEVADVFARGCGSEFGIGSEIADDRPVIYDSHPFVDLGC